MKQSILFALILLSTTILAQNTNDSTLTPFRKGRFLIGLNGNIRSATIQLNRFSPDELNFVSGYNFEFNGTTFIKDRINLGFVVFSTRSKTEQIQILENELLAGGLQFRYYINKTTPFSLYPKLSVYYARSYIFQEYETIDSLFKDSFTGSGPGFNLGLGFSYVLKDILVFDLTLGYNFMVLYGEKTDEILNTRHDQTAYNYDINFTFGFGILLNKPRRHHEE